MKRLADVVLVAVVLSACSGPPVTGQVSPAVRATLDRPILHEVPIEQEQEAQEAGFVEVVGTGMVSVPPDQASVSFAVETRASSAAGASTGNANAMDAVLRALRGADLTGLELQTFGYSLRPEYSSAANQRTREIIAYVALNNVRATVTDVNAVGRLIDVAVGAGANRVASIAFSAADTEPAMSEALALAVTNARSQAEVIARTLGHALGPALEVRGGSQRPIPAQADFAMMRALEVQAAPTPIEVGDQTVTASVTIRFAIGPELAR